MGFYEKFSLFIVKLFLYANEDYYESYIIVIVAHRPKYGKEPVILYLGQKQRRETGVTVRELKG